MSIDVGDLLPRGSGTASLGVEQISANEFSSDIRPFAHIHMLSGILHDPVQGTSGVFRFSRAQNDFEVSVDGGLTFIKLQTDLQRAYNRGNEIDPVFSNDHMKGVVIRETMPGANGITSKTAFIRANESFGICVSGYSLTPLDINRSPVTTIIPHGMIVRSSGTPELTATSLYVGYPTNTVPNVAIVATSGKLLLQGDEQLSLVTATGGIFIDTHVSSSPHDVTINAGGQLALNAFFFGGQTSGALEYRFGPYEGWSVFSLGLPVDGSPEGDGYWPLPHSGQIAEMIAMNGGGTPHSLQAAYDGGNEIQLDTIGVNNNGVLLKENDFGVHPLESTHFVLNRKDSYGIAVSGYSNSTDAGSTKIASNGILIVGSGVAIGAERNAELFIGYTNSGFSVDSAPLIFASGGLTVLSVGLTNLLIEQGGLSIDVEGGMTIDLANNLSISNPGSTNQIDISAGGSLALDTDTGSVQSRPFQNFIAQPFNNSGQLNYHFGPHQGWYVRTSDTSTGGPEGGGQFPLPHSGQIIQMILERSGLQQAYDADPTIVTTTNRDLIVTANAAKVKFSTFLSRSEISLSGISNRFPSVGLETGDLNMFTHGLVDSGPMGLNTLAAIQARSFGIGTIGLNTGSGIANIMMGSGVQRFLDTAGGTAVATFPTFTNVVLSSERFQRDQYYAYDSSATGVRVFVPGCYLAIGKTTIASTNTVNIFAALGLNGTTLSGYGDNGPVLAGGTAAFSVQGILNLHPRDLLALQVAKTGGTVTTVANESALHLIYLGPARGASS
jgi:hypothetical protein